jgi:hypothetical protein
MTPTLADLLLRDPEHPEVRRLLELRYRQVCAERDMLMQILKLATPRRERDQSTYDQRRQKIDG